jgi:hypothetical protein
MQYNATFKSVNFGQVLTSYFVTFQHGITFSHPIPLLTSPLKGETAAKSLPFKGKEAENSLSFKGRMPKIPSPSRGGLGWGWVTIVI